MNEMINILQGLTALGLGMLIGLFLQWLNRK